MSKNNAKMVQQKMSDQRQKFGIRKLSVGVASVLLGTVFYMQGGTVHADVNPTVNASSDSVNVVDENSGTSSLAVGSGTSNSAGSANSASPVVSASDVTNSIATSQASASPVDSAAGQVSNAASSVSDQGSVTPASQVNVGVDKIVKDENDNVDSDSTQVSNSQVAPEKSLAGSGIVNSSGATPSQSVLATPVETESPSVNLAVDSKAPNREMVDSKWTIHYVDQADHKQELKAPTVITMQYERTNTPQSDGTIQYGDWSYVSGSFKQTGTPITVYGSDNPTKEDNIITKNGENVDVFTINARYPTIKGYKFHDDHGAFLFNDLLNYDPSGHVQAPRMSGDIYAEYDDVKSLIDENDLTKTVTRIIKIVQPDGTIINKVQTVHLTRSATVDEATNQVKYGAWSTDQWDAYNVPTVDGYTPSHETVEAVTVDGHTYNKYVTITYTQTTHPIVETATKTLTEHFIYGGGDRQGKVAAPDSRIKLFFKRTNQVTADGTVTSYGQWELDPSQGTNGYQIVSGKWQIPEPGSYDVLRAVAELPDGRKLSVNENREYHYSSSLAWLNPETSAVDYFEDPDFYDVRAEHTTYVYPVTKYLYVHDQDPKHIGNSLIGSVLLTGYADESRDFTWDDIVAASKHSDADHVDLTNYELVPGQSQTVTADFEPQSPDLVPINVQHKHRQVQTIDHVKVGLVPALLSILYESTPDMLLTLNSQIDRYGFPLNPTYHEATVDVPVTLTYDAVTKWVLTAKVTPTTANIQESRYTDDELNGHDYGIAIASQGSYSLGFGPDWRQVLANPANEYHEQLIKLLGVPNEQTLDEAISKSTLKTAYFTYPKWDSATNIKQVVTKNEIVVDDGNLSFPDFSDFKGDEPLDHAPRLYDENKPLTDTIASYQILNLHFPKPVTRTINLHLPSGKVETVTQVVDAGKTVSFNADHGDLVLELAHDAFEWANYEVPAQAGYTSSQAVVAAQSVDEQTADQTVDVYYTANDHQISIKYVDDDQGEKVVGTGTVNGKTGTEVTITPSLPKGYMLTQGKDVPSTYTVTDAANQAVTIHVQKQFVDTSDTDPQAKQTRTITLHYVYGAGDKQGQKAFDDAVLNVYYHRTATLDRATNQTKYGDWLWDQSQGDPSTPGYHVVSGKWTNLPQSWANVTADVPSIKGYRADLGQNDPANTNHVPSNVWVYPTWNGAASTGDTLDGYESKAYQTSAHLYEVRPEHTVKYMPNKTTLTVKFVDDQSDEQQVGQATIVTGLDGDTVSLKLTVPDKYQLADGQQLPTSYTFTKGSGDLVIHLTHKVVQREATTNVYMFEVPYVYIGVDGLVPVIPKDQWDLIGMDDYGRPENFDALKKQLGTISGHVNYDLVTNQVTSVLDDWTSLDLQNQTFSVPKADAVVNGVMSYSEDTNGKTILEWMKENNWQGSFTDYLEHPFKAYLSQQLTKSAEMMGGPSFYRAIAPKVVPGEPDRFANEHGDTAGSAFKLTERIDRSYLETHQHSSDWKGGDSNDFRDQGGRLVSDSLLQVSYVYVPYIEKAVTRTITVAKPDGTKQQVIQTAALDKAINISDSDKMTWSTGEWTSYDAPTISGYTASQSQVARQAVTGETKDQTVNITYTANPQTTTVVYQTEDGTPVHTTTINGHTGQTVEVPSEVPAGWMITKGQVPSEITFGPNGYADETITIGHQHVTVDPDHPQTNGTKLPDNPAKTFNGVEANDLNKIITRTIKVTTPDGKVTTTKQTAKLTRTASVDEVTGAVTYGDWTTGEWAAYDAPSVAGYTPSQKTISSITVKSGDKDVEETVIYSPNKQVMTINYIDDVTGKTLSTKQLIGVSDASANYNTKLSINSYVVDHYKLVSDDTNSDNLVFDHDDSTDQVYNVHLTHTYQTVDDHKAVNETVHYVYDNGQTARPDYKAPVINFSRTGTKDLVTSNIVWNAWTPAEQSFDQVITPAINGYTPDVEFVPSVNVNHGSADVERTVIYHADDQTILVNYIDDDTHSTLKTDTVIGKTAQKSNHTTKKLIDGYVADHYELVSDDTNANELVFDSDSTKAQVYNVHLKHVHQNVSDSALVNETIHYIYADGSKARDDYHAPAISFKRTGDKDLVTNAIVWGAWTPVSQDFKAVDSPVIDGYTPSQKTISNITVKPGDKDIDQTVVYAPDTQSIVVNYIDDVTGKTLKTDTLTGKSDLVSDYTTKNNINGYENQHYVLVSDDTQGKTVIFDHDDKATQVYNVHLSHQTEPASQSRTVHEMIDYVYADGFKAADTVIANPLTFTQTGVKDLVNGNIDWNGTWTSKQTFAEVKSPEIIGYAASRASVDPIIVDHNSSDIHQTVIYVANNQTAKIKYIDDVTGKTLETDSANGKFGDQIKFGHGVDTQIKAFEGQGYKFKLNSFNGQKYQADNSQNEFEVHFTHGTQNVSRTNKVTETVKYQFADGRQAQKDHVQTVEFMQHGVQDLVTKITVWALSDPQTFVSVDTPHITGYTADIQNVPAATVKFGDGDIIKVVTYKANDQLAGIKYIDDTTGKTLDTEAASGKFGTKIEFMHDPSSMIQKFEGQGYKLVSSSFKDQAYQADNSKNQFEVHFIHGTQNVSRTNKVTETVKYQFADGRQAQKDHAQTVEFTQHGVQDLVTKTTDWTSSDPQTFVSVDSPKIIGYTADVQNVPAVTINFGDADITKVVTYKANDQLAGIKYIDDTTGKTLDTDSVNGKFGDQIKFGHDVDMQVKVFEDQGYKLVSNSFKDQDYQADNSKNQFEVHFKHGMKDVSRTTTITRTIKYVDQNTGKEVHQPVIQILTFTENGVTDLVAGKTTWESPSDQQFVKVESPKIDGYDNPDILVVDAKTAKFGDSDQTVTVRYQKVEARSTPNTSKAPSMSSTQSELNISTMSMHTPTQVGSQNASDQQIVNNHGESQLPQTGNHNSHQAGLFGLISLTLAGLLGFVKRRKKND